MWDMNMTSDKVVTALRNVVYICIYKRTIEHNMNEGSERA